MKETVEKILQEEESSRSKIEKARLEAEAIIKKARAEAVALIEAAALKSKAQAEHDKNVAEGKILSEKDHALKETKEKASVLKKSKEKDLSISSQEIFSQIIKFKE
jgi:vacuolar-type H+-ATPase subunit H